jgi:hypothetical protein
VLSKIVEAIKNQPLSKGNPLHEREAIEEATNTFNAGWDALTNGAVIMQKGNLVAIRESNNTIVTYEMENGCYEVVSGRLSDKCPNKIKRICKRWDVTTEEQKQIYLAQAIVTRFYTIKEA